MTKYFIGLCLGILIGSMTAFAQPTLNLIGNLDKLYWNDMSDVWGYVAPDGHEYGIATTQTGVAIIDLADPTNPTEIEYLSGANTFWREADVWGEHVYIVNEGNGGLLILDFTDIQNENISSTQWQGDTFFGSNVNFNTAHNFYIDENGIGYVVGADLGNGGIIMLDIASNPTDPEVVGLWNDRYVHDIFVRGDTAWTADINSGLVSIIDVSNKATPNVLNTISTPDEFAHHVWLSEDNQTLFVTEEVSNGAVTIYNVSNVLNPQFLGQYRSNPGSNVIPHNIFIKGDYAYISYYTDGAIALDISDPSNVVEVANYDTSPNFSGSGFHGAWGIYPFLPSGNILVTDIETGFFVLEGEPTNTAARTVSLKVYLEGAYDSTEGKMHTLLNSTLPVAQPYNVAPFDYTGNETLANIPSNMVDWVLIEARQGTPSLAGERMTNTVETRVGILLDNGNIVSATNTGEGVTFNNLVEDNSYYFCIRHRNHLAILTATPSVANTTNISYDFTTATNTALGAGQLKATVDGKSIMYVGDYNQDNIIQNTDFDTWRANPAQINIYTALDGNMDGVVQVTDYDIWVPNKAKTTIAETAFE